MPCFKLYGPKTEARLSPSRPIPTAIDAVISAEDVLLLQYAYSEQYGVHWSFIQTLPCEYGHTIEFAPLRHAVLAYAAGELPHDQFHERSQYHSCQTYEMLINKLDSAETITESDVFASCVLASNKIVRWRIDTVGVSYVECFLSLSKIFAKTSRGRSDFFNCFGSLGFDLVNKSSTCCRDSIDTRKEIFGPEHSCRQRLRCLNRLVGESSYTTRDDAVWLSLALSLNIQFSLMITAVEEEAIGNFQRDPAFMEHLEYIKLDLDDLVYVAAPQKLNPFEDEDEDEDQVDDEPDYDRDGRAQLPITFLNEILTAPTITDGLQGPAVSIGTHMIEKYSYERHNPIYHLLLGGLVLRDKENSHCTFPKSYLNIDFN